MGEIKIKSENLFDINGEHTSVVWDDKDCLIISDNAVIVNVVRPGYMTGIYYDKVYKPGTYTFAMKQLAVQSNKTEIRVVSSAPFTGGEYNKSYKAYTATFIKHNDTHYITIVVTEPTEIGFFVNRYFSVNDKIYDIQLLEGTYTSETIPEYQPYFLNRPAHQYVNGECIDIPTHHFINNRWQGELTSQSPLKFRADGEMLDWRVEGKTSGNLFDTSVYNNTVGRINCTVTNTLNSIAIEAIGTDPYIGPYVPAGSSIASNVRSLYIPVKPNTTYTINMSSAPKCFWLKVDENDISRGGGQIGALPYSFTTDELTKYIIIRLGNGNLQAGDSFTFENIQILEGTYTADTLPPYEPYGGVGDWDETEQKHRIPVRVEGENLFDINGNYSAYVYQGSPVCRVDNQQIIVNAVAPYYFTYINFSAPIPSGQYTIKCKASANFRAMRLLLTKPFDTGTWNDSYQRYYADMIKNDNYYTYTFNVDEDFSIGFAISGATGDTGVIEEIMLNEGTTAFPYEGITTTLYTDHQLMDGDSIDYATDQTTIPLATGNNTLTVDTAVKPKSVFVKFEG